MTSELNGIEKQTGNTIAERMAIEAKLDKLNQDIHDERTQYILLQNEIEQALLLKQEVIYIYRYIEMIMSLITSNLIDSIGEFFAALLLLLHIFLCFFVSLEFQNLDLIVRLQNRAKRYRSIVQIQQIPKNRSESVVDTQLDRNKEINITLTSILDDLIDEFPEHKFSIQRVRQTLKD